jgi:hypothetical protein
VTVKATLAAAGQVRFRVPQWSTTLDLDGKAITPQDGWVEVAGRVGENAWTLHFDMLPRLVDWTGRDEAIPPSPQLNHDEIPEYTVHFMEWYTPDMAGLSRHGSALRLLRGPLVLAKGRLAGTSREETLFASTLREQGWRAAALRPAACTVANAGVDQSWTLVLERGDETREIPVADYASVSNIDDPANWFSLWF